MLTHLLLLLQTQNRMKLMADNYEDDNLKVTSPNSEQPNNHKPSPDQARPLRLLPRAPNVYPDFSSIFFSIYRTHPSGKEPIESVWKGKAKLGR